ncbi:MAG: O-antigen ligase family protein [Ktedonobacteraceae bacterium]|nr:O-antigen ligase family protein [Ktedonobacteraceae bacterium]
MHVDMQSLMVDKDNVTVPRIRAARKRGDLLLHLAFFVAVFSLAPLLVLGGLTIGLSFLVAGVAAVVATFCLVRWPGLGLFVLAICATLVEQEALKPAPPFTNYLFVFYWPASLQGLPERPIGFFILFAFFALLCQRLATRQGLLKGGALFLPFCGYMLCVAWGVIHGLTSGGNLKVVVLEVRPFWYFFISYMMAYNLVSQKKHVQNLFWVIIICAGIKALQGTYIYLIVLHGDLTGHHEIMAHEESFFFVAVLLLVVLFCIHYRARAQLYVALAILPFLLIALLGNQRRADYLALLIGIVIAWVLTFITKPKMRKSLLIGMIICSVLGGGYVAAFYKSPGTFAQPARALVSVFQPDVNSSDYQSNLYREIENYDLRYTISRNPLGAGFGKQFEQPIPLPNIQDLDPYYLFIPHNTIYWIWMRLGPIGYLAFWFLIGGAIVRGCLIARSLRDPYLRLVAIFIVAVTVMEIILAYADYQLYFYRNVIYLGILFGVLVKLPALEEKKEQSQNEVADGVRLPASSLVGSGRA